MSIISNLLETSGVEIVNKLAAQFITKDALISWLKSAVAELKALSLKSETKIDDSIVDALEKAINELK